MKTFRLSLLCLALAAGFLLGMPRAALAEIHPSSDVLMPYFELELKGTPEAGRTSLFAICNDGDDPITIKVSVITNWGIPVLDLDLTIAPDAVRTVNLRDWLQNGQLPDGRTLTPAKLAFVQAALSGKPVPGSNLYYGTEVAPDLAVGAVVFRDIAVPRPDVLWGDSFVVDTKLGYSEGETLVNLDPTIDPPPLCKRHGIRFLSGGIFDAGTEFMIWTDRVATPSASAELPLAQKVGVDAKFYDEAGNVFDQRHLDLIPLQRITVSDLGLTKPFGWVELTTETDSFITGHFSASNTYSSAFHAYCLPEELGPTGPGIRVEKLTNGAAADSAPGPIIPVGGKVEWTYVVTNTGNAKLTGIAVIDTDHVDVACPDTRLNPGESMICTASGTAKACQHENTARVTGTPPSGNPVADSDISHYYGERRGQIAVQSYLNGDDADTAPGTSLHTGDALHWTYMVTNTGDFKLSGVLVADEHGFTVTCPKADLEAGESMTCTANGTAVVGNHAYVATARGAAACGPQVVALDPTHYTVPSTSGITLRKLTNGQDANTAPGVRIVAGQTVQWTYQVTNTGNVRLSAVSVVDDQGVDVTCPKNVLEAGESMTCTASGKAINGQYCNLGTAAGTPEGGSAISATDPSCYLGIRPGISLQKLTNGYDADDPPGPTLVVGSVVTWTYVVTNTGDVELTQIQVADDRDLAVTCPKTVLQAGESMTCTANGTAVAGQYANVGTATGKPADAPTVTASDPSHYFGQTQGGQGCTPGYWKNHTDSWAAAGYSPSQQVVTVFSEAYRFTLGSSTLLQALDGVGGPDLEGAAEILVRAATAAVLNAAHPGVTYPRTVTSIVSDTNTALASGSRDHMLILAAALDADNNLGCPLN